MLSFIKKLCKKAISVAQHVSNAFNKSLTCANKVMATKNKYIFLTFVFIFVILSIQYQLYQLRVLQDLKKQESEVFSDQLNQQVYQSESIMNKLNPQNFTSFENESDIQKLLQNEKQKIGVSSENTINSYLRKYSFDLFKNKFEFIGENPLKRNGVKILNTLLGDQSVLTQKIYFTKNNSRSSHSIDGKLTLSNQSNNQISFIVPSGQIFGNKQNTHQHVVVRQIQGELRPNETKEFHLEGFCADKSTSWPQDNTNYEPTNLKLKNFDNYTTQTEVWNQTL